MNHSLEASGTIHRQAITRSSDRNGANEGESDQIAIFKGFSSSLMRPTAFDPEVPVLPDKAKILTIDE